MKKKIIIAVSIIFLLVVLSVGFFYFSQKAVFKSNKTGPGINTLLNQEKYQHADWGIMAIDLETNEVLENLNQEKLFIPASTTKLFTVAAALDILGSQYRFKTPVYINGKVNSKGVLKGDLILVAGGDICLGGRTLTNETIAYTSIDHTDANSLDGATLTDTDPKAGLNFLAKRVAASGIKAIDGEVIIDDRMYGPRKTEASYLLTPIMVNDNLIDLVIMSTSPGEPATVIWQPQSVIINVNSSVKTVAPGKANEIQVTTNKNGDIIVKGQIASDQKKLLRTYQVKDAASFARSLLIEALDQAGVAVDAPIKAKNPKSLLPDKNAYAKLKKVAVYTSPPFSEYAKLILKVSHNPGADTLLFLIANQKDKKTFEDGLLIEKDFLKKTGIDLNQVFIGDGQGGVPSDMISPLGMVQLLDYMSKRPDFEIYKRSLPILGVDGTLADMASTDSPVRGKVQAKTGTSIIYVPMNESLFLKSKALAGYMTTEKGRKLAFCFYVNNTNMPGVDSLKGILGFATEVGTDLGKIAEIIWEAE